MGVGRARRSLEMYHLFFLKILVLYEVSGKGCVTLDVFQPIV